MYVAKMDKENTVKTQAESEELKMTLDEAIKHAEEVAKEKEAQAWEAQLQEEYEKIKSRRKCAEEHRQLAEWLKDYKRLLEQEPCEDWYDVPSDEMTLEQARQAVKDLRKKLAEYLEQEPCEDCISRQAVLAIAGDSCLDLDSYDDTKEFCDEIKELPSVTPQPNKQDVSDVLDKIKAEIEQEIIPRNSDQYNYEAKWQNLGLRMALKVIDKYKAESEE